MRLARTVLALFALLIAAVSSARASYVINNPNGNVSLGTSVSVNWAFTAGDSLIAVFAITGGSGTFPNTVTDSVGNVYTILKNATGSPYPSQSGFMVGTYVCVIPAASPVIGTTLNSPLSGSLVYSYLIEWYLTPSGGGSPIVFPPGSIPVTDKSVWTFQTSSAFTPLLLPAYGSQIPDNTISVGLFMTADGTAFDGTFHAALSPILFGGWDFGSDAVLGFGWNTVFPYNCYPGIPSSCGIDPGNEYYEVDSGGVTVLTHYIVFHVENGPTSATQPQVQTFIGD